MFAHIGPETLLVLLTLLLALLHPQLGANWFARRALEQSESNVTAKTP